MKKGFKSYVDRGLTINEREKETRNLPNEQPTHISFCLLVGAGIDQQPHTVGAITNSGRNQRRTSVLRVGFTAAPNTAMAIAQESKIVHTIKSKWAHKDQ